MTSPLVSVVLSVRNGEVDLRNAIESIQTQTFRNLELICINNGSTDQTAAILDGINDPRVRVFHQEDKGLAAALNRGIFLSRGRYIARQDHDDLALPTRIEKQVSFMEAHPDCALVGTWAEIWAGDRRTERAHDHPADDAVLKFELLFNNPFVHSSVMLRKSALDDVGGYSIDQDRQPPEDYELWSRLSRRFQVANLPERLTIYREVPTSMSREGMSPFLWRLVLISAENLATVTGVATDDRHRDIAALVHGTYEFLSREPDIEGMCQIIRDAGACIGSRTVGTNLTPLVDARISNLRAAYQKYRIGLHRLQPLVTIAGRVAFIRRLARYLKS